jgi:hypothetical protein
LPCRSRGESLIRLGFLNLHPSSRLLSSHLSSCGSSRLSLFISSCLSSFFSAMSRSFSFSSKICYSLYEVCNCLLLLLVIGLLYLFSFNYGLVLVLFELVSHFFSLVFHPSFSFEEFLFLLLEPVFAKTFLILPWFRLLLFQDYIADEEYFIDYLIQFITRAS